LRHAITSMTSFTSPTLSIKGNTNGRRAEGGESMERKNADGRSNLEHDDKVLFASERGEKKYMGTRGGKGYL